MGTKTLIRSLHLGNLTHFLDRVEVEAVRSFEEIEGLRLDGKLADFASYEHADSLTASFVAIACRAVAQELANLVEHELQEAATVPWLKSDKSGPKTFEDLDGDDFTTLRAVSDISFGKAVRLIDAHYSISVASLDGWSEVSRLRQIVNDLKHRHGMRAFKAYERDEHGSMTFPQFAKFDQQDARDAIVNADRFLRSLDKRIAQDHQGPIIG